MRKLAIAMLLALATVRASPDARAAGNDAYRRLSEGLVEGHVLPRYGQFERATGALRAETETFCATPTAASLAILRENFAGAFDAWQGIQHIRFGPIELFMRSMRIAFWPDPRGAVSRQLDEVLVAGDAAAFTPTTLAKGNLPVQGLPALERLLFGNAAQGQFLSAGADAAFRCTAVRSIAANIAGMAHDLRKEWAEGNDAQAQAMSAAGKSGSRYSDVKEVTLDLFKSLHAAVELVADHKLARPLGPSRQAARPQLAEAARSRLSLPAIRVNLQAAEAMYLGEGGRAGFSSFVRNEARDSTLDDLLREAFAQTRATAAGIDRPLEEAVSDAKHRRKLVQLPREASALKALLAQRLTVALDIPLGFNALDRD